MPKVARVSTPVTIPVAWSTKSDHHQLIVIALFCGIGLLVSLVAMLVGIQGAWY